MDSKDRNTGGSNDHERADVDRGAHEDHPQNPSAVRRGSPGFHLPDEEEQLKRGDGVSPASLELDAGQGRRVNTGTGDQPGNTGGSRTGTPSRWSEEEGAHR
jgi:hypothetical protein